MSKDHTELGCVRWASRRGVGEPNPSRKSKTSGANGDRNWRTQKYIKNITKYKYESTCQKAEANRQSGTARSATVTEQESFNDWGGAGMSQICPRFGMGRHENSPSQGLI